MSLPGYDAWLEAPYTDTEHDCPTPDDCTCEEDAREAHEDAQIERADARRKGDEYA